MSDGTKRVSDFRKQIDTAPTDRDVVTIFREQIEWLIMENARLNKMVHDLDPASHPSRRYDAPSAPMPAPSDC